MTVQEGIYFMIKQRLCALLLSAMLALGAGPLEILRVQETPEIPDVPEMQEWQESLPAETASETDLAPAAPDDEEEMLEGAIDLPGMPESYTLSSAQLAEKAATREHRVAAELDELEAGKDYISDEIIFLAESEAEAEQIAAAYGAELIVWQYGVGTARIKPQSGHTVQSLVAAGAREDGNLPPVSPNHILTVDALPNDAFLSMTSSNYQWFHDAVGSLEAWAVTKGAGAKVAVLDTGIQAGHPEFRGINLVADSTAIQYDNYGRPYAYYPPDDENGHGTHVSGAIVAAHNAGGGAAGIAPGVSLHVSIRVFQGEAAGGGARTDETIAGINLASGNNYYNVDVINMSLGGPSYNAAYQTACTTARRNGTAIFASAGNDGVSNKNYPAAFNDVISVAATREDGSRADFSNYGATVDIASPGVRIVSTVPTSRYEAMNGTSMASPIATGVGALVMSMNPGMTPAQLEAHLERTAVKSPSSGVGAGVINVKNALNIAPKKPSVLVPNPPILRPPTGDGSFWTDTAAFTITGGSGDRFFYTTTGKSPVVVNGNPAPGTLAYSGPVTLSGNGSLTVKAVAVGFAGKVSAVATTKFKLQKKVTSLTIAGPQAVSAGKSIQLSATVLPGDILNKKVGWAVLNRPDGVSISSNGKLTTKSSAPAGPVTVQVITLDGSAASARHTVTIHTAISGVGVTSGSVAAAGRTVSLTAAVQPADFPNQKVTWAFVGAVDPSVAKLNATTGKLSISAGASGSLRVRATSVAGGVASPPQTINIIAAPANSVSIAEASKTLTLFTAAPGNTATVQASAHYGTNRYSTGYLAWKSSNTRVATVNQSGQVTALAKGKATITATAADGSGKKATCTVNVYDPVTAITLTPSTGTLALGKTLKLKATFGPASAGGASNMSWVVTGAQGGMSMTKDGRLTLREASPSGVQTVQVRAQWKLGSRTVTSNTASITVYNNPAAKVVVNTPALELFTVKPMYGTKGATGQVSASVQNRNGTTANTCQNVRWTSGNTKVAAVNEATGAVTAIGPGTATLTATAQDGTGKKATCKVRVDIPVSSVQIFSSSRSMTADNNDSAGYAASLNGRGYALAFGKSLQLRVKFGTLHGEPSNKKVNWSIYGHNISASYYNANPIKINASGKLSVSSAYSKGITTVDNAMPYVIVQAAAADGSNVGTRIIINLAYPTANWFLMHNGSLLPYGSVPKSRSYSGLSPYTRLQDIIFHGTGPAVPGIAGRYYRSAANFSATSSNSNVVRPAGPFYDEGSGYHFVALTAIRSGSATIKVTANDGTNKSFTIKVTVRVSSSGTQSQTAFEGNAPLAIDPHAAPPGLNPDDAWVQTEDFALPEAA